MCIKILIKSCGNQQKALPLHSQFRNAVGAIAQLVEQRTENPCVPGSIPGGTTTEKQLREILTAFLCCSVVMLLCCDYTSTTQQNISQHVDNIYKDGELIVEATNKKFLLVRQEGNRKVKRNIDYYNLDMIIALGSRTVERAINF